MPGDTSQASTWLNDTNRDSSRDAAHDVTRSASPASAATGKARNPAGANHAQGLLKLAKRSFFGWWQNHPLHIAADVAKPYLDDYARSKPLQLLGIAAGLGALAVLIKPWRLVSATGLAALAVKSTNVPATLLSFLSQSTARAPEPARSHFSKGPP